MTETRFMGDLLGSYVLSSRISAADGKRVFACRTRSISAREMVVTAPVVGRISETLGVAFQELGKLRAIITRHVPGGFVAEFDVDDLDRRQLEQRISWLKRRSLRTVEDRREFKRVLPRDPSATLLIGQGEKTDCLIIDMSRSGVAISADVLLRPGALVAVGAVPGRVIRPVECGFALQFAELQDLETLEGRLTLKTGPQRVEAARKLGLIAEESA